jgi:hypothetical protein
MLLAGFRSIREERRGLKRQREREDAGEQTEKGQKQD